MTQKRKSNRRLIMIIAGISFGFLIVFQFYIVKENKKIEDLLNHSFSVIEGSFEEDAYNYYISNQRDNFNELIQSYAESSFKPTELTRAPALYTIHIYDETLKLATKLIVRENKQVEVNDALYIVDAADTSSFEAALFSQENETVLRDFQEIVTHMYGYTLKGTTISEQNDDWAPVIALARVAQAMEVNMSKLELLSVAPTKEVAEQLIHYDITSSVNESALIEAIRNERYDVAEVVLENEIGLTYDFALESVISPVAVAKLNEADEMVELLLTYGFEDVYVDPEHIETVQQAIDFSIGNTKEMTNNLTEGKLPGIDTQLPVSTSEIVEEWGEHTSNEELSTLNYRHHTFFRLINLHRGSEDRNDLDVYAYQYEFPPTQLIHQGEIKELLGEPNFIEEFEYFKEMGYTFGEYDLNFIVDLEGYIDLVHYYYQDNP